MTGLPPACEALPAGRTPGWKGGEASIQSLLQAIAEPSLRAQPVGIAGVLLHQDLWEKDLSMNVSRGFRLGNGPLWLEISPAYGGSQRLAETMCQLTETISNTARMLP